ncbi:MAG: Npun_R1517 family heterocyst differentiation transcriptional regulator [Leptolyngbya sp. SIO1E4]|nr:Npun_R1517 family heterocyst differentiation transcriptional regulator [Leptolyngbya sp. SIO1E4]
MTYCSSNTNKAIQPPSQQVGVYECEVTLKFRLLEENLTRCDREQLLQLVVDAFAYGSDEYLETLHTEVAIQEVSALNASPEMRRQLIRLRNASA